MNEIERKAAMHATWRVFTFVVGIVAIFGGALLGASWLANRYGFAAVSYVGAALLLLAAVVGMWSASYSYAKRQIENGTPKSKWWF